MLDLCTNEIQSAGQCYLWDAQLLETRGDPPRDAQLLDSRDFLCATNIDACGMLSKHATRIIRVEALFFFFFFFLRKKRSFKHR